MRWLLILLVLLPSLALAQFPISRGGTVRSGPRILGEPAFAFELDALEQAEVSRPGWPVTTTRASTRMCFTGTAWQTVPANTPCIGASGLASFGAGTNYTVNSAGPFDAAPWFLSGSPSLESLGNGVWRATSTGASDYVAQTGPAVAAGEVWTVTAEVQGATSGGVRLRALNATAAGGTGVQCTRDVGAEWTRVSCTQTAVADGQAQATLYFDSGASRGSVQFRQIQLEKSATPGPRHDCEAAPCSWQGDVHTVPPAGWPVASGEVRLQYTPLVSNPGAVRWLIDASIFNASGWELYIRDTNAIGFFSHRSGANSLYSSSALTWVAGQTYEIRVAWGGGALRMWRDGVLVYENLAADMPVGPLTTPAVSIGVRRLQASTTPANGHIRLLRVSQ